MWYNRQDQYIPTGETYGPIDSPIYEKNGKKYIKVSNAIDNRYLILPSTEPIINCTEMMQENWNKLLKHSKYHGLEERQMLKEEFLKRKEIKATESMQRKRELQRAMETAEKTRKLNPLEKEAKFLKNYCLDRANDLLLDDEDSMKQFNTMIALKKCIATWDQQILEKAKIKEDQKKENLREEKEAEMERRQYVKEDEKQRQKLNADMQNFIQTLGEQIKEREIDRKIKMELKQLERQRFNKAAIQLEADELELEKLRVKENEKLRGEQRRVNLLLQRLQMIDKEEDRLFNEKMKATTDEIQKEVEEKKMKQMEIERKRKEELQKMADEKVKTEEQAKFKELMDEVLRMDNIERTWRQKELMEAQVKKQRLDAMFEQLEQQVEGRRLAKARAIDDERHEVCKNAKDNIDDEAKDHEDERKIKLANEKQRLEILLQINDIDRRKIADRQDKVLESKFYKIQEEKRLENITDCMWRKADKLRKDGLPETYVLEVENFILDKYGPRTVKTN
ncbi:uncharacterized protein [Rhodnius prolixus]|uniref:Cilia- and flagella-associated protein 45 n=1 Tax=Rhodnius prolixus TaxID=13249 RepID=R4G462_RHOPR